MLNSNLTVCIFYNGSLRDCTMLNGSLTHCNLCDGRWQFDNRQRGWVVRHDTPALTGRRRLHLGCRRVRRREAPGKAAAIRASRSWLGPLLAFDVRQRGQVLHPFVAIGGCRVNKRNMGMGQGGVGVRMQHHTSQRTSGPNVPTCREPEPTAATHPSSRQGTRPSAQGPSARRHRQPASLRPWLQHRRVPSPEPTWISGRVSSSWFPRAHVQTRRAHPNASRRPASAAPA